MTDKATIKERIDADEGLKSKRLWLTTVSVLVIALSFAGIKITGVNTLIFTLEIENKDGIGLLLFLSVIFLMIRYFSYAKKYHDDLTELWKKDLMNDHEIANFDYEGREAFGLAYKKAPEWFHTELDLARQENISQHVSYLCAFPFRRYFVYSSYYEDHDHEREEPVSILSALGFRDYIKILGKELRYQSLSFIKYPEFLDIYAPYMIGITAVITYIMIYSKDIVGFFSLLVWMIV